MAQPSQLPEWNTDGSAPNRTEPSAGKKALGWEVNESPPSSWFNWWMFRVYEWALYLDRLVDGLESWLLRQTFLDGILASAPSTADRHGVEATGNGNGNGLRGTGGTSNGTGVVGIGGATNGVGVAGQGSGTGAGGTFAGGGTGGSGIVANGVGAGVAVEAGAGHVLLSAANPASTAGFTNRLTPLNIPKVWATVKCNGDGTFTIEDGFNVTDAIAGTGANDVKVRFTDDLANDDYTVVGVVEIAQASVANLSVGFHSRLVGSTEFKVFDTLNTPIAAATSTFRVMLTVFGRQ